MQRRVTFALLAAVVCHACGYKSDPPKQSITAAVASPINSAPTIEDFVLFGTHSVLVRSQAEVLGADVGVQLDTDGPFLMSGYELGIDTFATVDPGQNLLAAAVRLKNKCSVGDVQALAVDNQNCTTGVLGTWPAMPGLPSALVASPATDLVVVPNGGTVQLGPDEAHGDVHVKKDGVLLLEGGDYHFNDVLLDQYGWIQASAPVSIRIAGRLLAKKRNQIGPAEGSGLSAGDVRVDVWGENGVPGNPNAKPSAIEVGWESKVHALMLAPNGTLQLDKGVRATGAFFARDVGRWRRVSDRVRRRIPRRRGVRPARLR